MTLPGDGDPAKRGAFKTLIENCLKHLDTIFTYGPMAVSNTQLDPDSRHILIRYFGLIGDLSEKVGILSRSASFTPNFVPILQVLERAPMPHALDGRAAARLLPYLTELSSTIDQTHNDGRIVTFHTEADEIRLLISEIEESFVEQEPTLADVETVLGTLYVTLTRLVATLNVPVGDLGAAALNDKIVEVRAALSAGAVRLATEVSEILSNPIQLEKHSSEEISSSVAGIRQANKTLQDALTQNLPTTAESQVQWVSLITSCLVEIVRQSTFQLRAQGASIQSNFSGLEGRIEAVEQARESEELTTNVRESKELLNTQRDAVADTAHLEISKYYQRISKTERLTALAFRTATTILFVATIVVTALLFDYAIRNKNTAIPTSLAKLVYEVPVILFILYLGRQESAHRSRSRRAGEYAARLKTLVAFTTTLDDEQKAQLRMEVGQSILTGPASLTSEKDKDNIDLDDLQKIADIIQRQSGNVRSVGETRAP